MSYLESSLKKSLSAVLSSALVFTSLSLPAISQAAPATPFALPARLGSITDSYKAGGSRQVVLIQDLHLHYPTQKRILQILNHLFDKKLVAGPIAIEGWEGPFDTTPLAISPAGKTKDKLVDYFMKKGELSGDEAFSILRGEGRLLYGVDHAKFHQLNQTLYKNTLENRHALETPLNQIQKRISLLKKEHYSRALHQLDKTEAYDVASAEQLLKQKLDLVTSAKWPAEKATLVRNIIEIDHSLAFLTRLLRQEVTLEEVRYISQRVPQFVQLTQKLLELNQSTVSTDLEDTLKSAIDFYAVALMRDQPMAKNTLELLPAKGAMVLVAGGFHTAGLTQAFKKAGVGYVVITPHIDEIEPGYHALYEQRVAGKHLTFNETARDLKISQTGQTLRVVTSLPTTLKPLWDLSWKALASGRKRVNRVDQRHEAFRQRSVRLVQAHPIRSLSVISAVALVASFLVGSYVPLLAITPVVGLLLVNGDDLPFQIAKSYPAGAHPILQRVKEIGPIQVLAEGKPLSDEDETLIRGYLTNLIHGHSLAAFDAWRFSALNHKVGKFGDKVATDALTRWYNMMSFILFTQASEGARDDADTVSGRYGLPALLGLNIDPELLYANDPVEVTERLQRKHYLANTSIAAYALTKLYKKYGKLVPSLQLPDEVYMMGVVGPKGSGVSAQLDPEIWVKENIRRAGAARGKEVNQVRVTGVLLRERHLQLMNDTLQTLQFKLQDIPEQLRTYLVEGPDGLVSIPKEQVTPFKEYVKKKMGGLVTLRNAAGGSLTMVTDGDVMPAFSLSQDADIAFGAGGVAEAMVKTRGEYVNIDFSGFIISNAKTKDGKADAVQVLDPKARQLSDDEIAKVQKAALPVTDGRVHVLFGLDELTGGPYNLTIISSPLGDPETRESNFVPGLREVEVLENGAVVRVMLLVVEPSGRKMLVPIIYDTGLRELQAEIQTAQESGMDSSKQEEMYARLGRLYGNLKMYDQAETELTHALSLAVSVEEKNYVLGMQAYYRGMKELLVAEKPDVELAKKSFQAAKDYGYVLAPMMLEVIDHGKPITVEPAEMVDLIDNLVKAAPEGRITAENMLISRIRTVSSEHLSAIQLLLNKLNDFLEASPQDGPTKEFISRIAAAIADNPALSAKLTPDVEKLKKTTGIPADTSESREDRLTKAEQAYRKPIVGGNWKMAIKTRADAAKLLREVASEAKGLNQVEVFIAPSAPHLPIVSDTLKELIASGEIPEGLIHLGAQDMLAEEPGAVTGQNSYEQYKDMGVTHIIFGHSEQRRGNLKKPAERRVTLSSPAVNDKVKTAVKQDFTAVVAVGETNEEYEAKKTFEVIEEQILQSLEGLTAEEMNHVVIAYEPIWAIGTGKTASPEDANRIQRAIRGILLDKFGDEVGASVRIQYGGSMKPDNAPQLMEQPNVDGGLIGGAALNGKQFAGILKAADAQAEKQQRFLNPEKTVEVISLPSSIREDAAQSLATLQQEQVGQKMIAASEGRWDDDGLFETIGKDPAPRMGWIQAAKRILAKGLLDPAKNVHSPVAIAGKILTEKPKYITFSGMGGSSLAIKLLLEVYGQQKNAPHIFYLDTTDPTALRQIQAEIYQMETGKPLPETPSVEEKAVIETALKTKTQAIGVTKSATTAETLSHMRFFAGFGVPLWILTDPPAGSNPTLLGEARYMVQAGYGKVKGLVKEGIVMDSERIFWIELDGNTHHGGRFSAPGTNVYLLAAQLMGLPLERHLQAAEQSANLEILSQDPFIALGAALDALDKNGKDKLTLLLPKELEPFGDWVDQLVQESLGKNGAGISVYFGEPLNLDSLQEPNNDRRVFLAITGTAYKNPHTGFIGKLKESGYPVIELPMSDSLKAEEYVPALMYGFERMVATFAYLQKINFVNQPAVQDYKNETREILEEAERAGLPVQLPSAKEVPAYFGRWSLNIDALIENKVVTSGEIADKVGLLGGNIRNRKAEEIYAALLWVVHEKGLLNNSELSMFGKPSPQLQQIMEKTGEKLFNGVFRIPSKVGRREQDNHSTEQFGNAGKAGRFSTFLALNTYPKPIVGKYPDDVIKASAIGTVRSRAKKGRIAVLLTATELDPKTTGDLEDFFKAVRAKLQNSENVPFSLSGKRPSFGGLGGSTTTRVVAFLTTLGVAAASWADPVVKTVGKAVEKTPSSFFTTSNIALIAGVVVMGVTFLLLRWFLKQFVAFRQAHHQAQLEEAAAEKMGESISHTEVVQDLAQVETIPGPPSTSLWAALGDIFRNKAEQQAAAALFAENMRRIQASA